MKKKRIFRAMSMDWSERDFSINTLYTLTWNVYNDKSVIITPVYVVSGRQKPIKTMLDEESFNRIKEIIAQHDLLARMHDDACDGEGWDMTVYDQDGSILSHNCGYIYGVKPLEEVVNILEENIPERETNIPDEI